MILTGKRKRLEVDKWFFLFCVENDWMRMADYTKVITIALIKPTQKPSEGVELRRGEYKGFYFKMRVWIPVSVDRWR